MSSEKSGFRSRATKQDLRGGWAKGGEEGSRAGGDRKSAGSAHRDGSRWERLQTSPVRGCLEKRLTDAPLQLWYA